VLRLSPVRSSTAPSESTPACINGSSAPTERPSVACTACSTDDLIATAASAAADDCVAGARDFECAIARWLRPPPRLPERGAEAFERTGVASSSPRRFCKSRGQLMGLAITADDSKLIQDSEQLTLCNTETPSLELREP